MRKMLLRWCMGAVCAAFIIPLVVSRTSHRVRSQEPSAEGDEVPAALALKMAQAAKFAPWTEGALQENPDGFAEQDWLEHNTDGQANGPAPFTAFQNARKDWKAVKARGPTWMKDPGRPTGPPTA